MEPSKDGRLDDAAVGVGGPSGASRDLLRETLVRALRVEVAPVRGKHAVEVTVAEDEDVVKALAPDAAEEAFADRVRRWRADGGPNHPRADAGGSAVEERAELGVAITQQEARTPAVWRRVAQLRLNVHFQNRTTWTEQDIQDRGRDLFQLAKKVWPGP